jgi:hypothetical protein
MESSEVRGRGHRCSARSRASMKCLRSMACFGAGGVGVLQAKRSRSTACFGPGGSDVL